MGLDMYLYLGSYESRSRWDITSDDSNSKTKSFYPKELKTFEDELLQHNLLSKETMYQVGYWRKFNALHGYFTDKLNKGNEIYDTLYIDDDELENLTEILKKVNEILSKSATHKNEYGTIIYDCQDEIKNILPPKDGFFFGSLDIDEYYKADVEYSIDLFEKVLKFIKEQREKNSKIKDRRKRKSWSIYYDASW